MDMAKYEFSFVVTEVDLSPEQVRVGRAVALAGAAELGEALPADAVSAPVELDAFHVRYWCGIPRVLEFPPNIERDGELARGGNPAAGAILEVHEI
jgi:hypothetical protein